GGRLRQSSRHPLVPLERRIKPLILSALGIRPGAPRAGVPACYRQTAAGAEPSRPQPVPAYSPGAIPPSERELRQNRQRRGGGSCLLRFVFHLRLCAMPLYRSWAKLGTRNRGDCKFLPDDLRSRQWFGSATGQKQAQSQERDASTA